MPVSASASRRPSRKDAGSAPTHSCNGGIEDAAWRDGWAVRRRHVLISRLLGVTRSGQARTELGSIGVNTDTVSDAEIESMGDQVCRAARSSIDEDTFYSSFEPDSLLTVVAAIRTLLDEYCPGEGAQLGIGRGLRGW